MWAIGCTFLEFIIWLLYGRNAFNRFYKSWAEHEGFYVFNTNTDGKVVLRVEVQNWIDYVYEQDLDPKDRPCTSQAIKEIVDFIRNELLIATPLGAYSAPKVASETSPAEKEQVAQMLTRIPRERSGPIPPAIVLNSADQPAGDTSPAQYQQTPTNPGDIGQRPSDLGPSSPQPSDTSDRRATSKDLCRKLKAICENLERHDTQAFKYILNNKPHGDASGPLAGTVQKPLIANTKGGFLNPPPQGLGGRQTNAGNIANTKVRIDS
jgi:hypothetical protein